ncbi:LysE family translocator [Aquibaculum arenosum]|uniref:LysE family translocator n=1 Tax=Aquibaculum arenosum TaxID=3032591 RepID=A0ABT5YIP6_9PROT|nr:LysE family translocator [Fodinicurvata sp. CAU 1616]MDF2094806.1 LysE family translocator [Fodinicurvata sp. CAU 1616]
MSIETWLAFVAAAAVLVAIPGPTITLVVAYALSRGAAAARWTIAGVLLGDLTAMTASLLGVGALLAASATAFMVVKWLGVLYLLWLGVALWRAPVAPLETAIDTPLRGPRVMAHTFAVTALNPKGIVFFVAFLPQFVTPSSAVVPQLVLLGATFLALAGLNCLIYALLAGRLRRRLRSPQALRWMNRLGGSVLIGAGLLAASLRRAGG